MGHWRASSTGYKLGTYASSKRKEGKVFVERRQERRVAFDARADGGGVHRRHDGDVAQYQRNVRSGHRVLHVVARSG